jgi:hypothetical protein
MKSLEDHLNDQLEHRGAAPGHQRQHPGGFLRPAPEREHHPEIADLIALASYLQQAPQIQVAPDFARQLERRIIRRQAELRLQRGHKRRSLFSLLRMRPVLSGVLGVCLFFCLLSTSVLALAAQITDPASPLYALKRWEQQVQIRFSSPADQAALDLQFAQDRLQTLASLADAAHEEAYEQALADLDQQINAAASAIKSLPAGASHDHLADELVSLKRETIKTLRLLLPRLTLSECLETTNELAHVGDRVPLLTRATLTLPAHPNGRATISLFGTTIEAGAHLLVDGRAIEGSGTLHNGQITFVINWNGNQHPRSLGLLNPDSTAAQTTTITITGTSTSTSTRGASSGNQNSNGKKPSVTPTPNGHKPGVTPTPNGHKPSVTPTPHH